MQFLPNFRSTASKAARGSSRAATNSVEQRAAAAPARRRLAVQPRACRQEQPMPHQHRQQLGQHLAQHPVAAPLPANAPQSASALPQLEQELDSSATAPQHPGLVERQLSSAGRSVVSTVQPHSTRCRGAHPPALLAGPAGQPAAAFAARLSGTTHRHQPARQRLLLAQPHPHVHRVPDLPVQERRDRLGWPVALPKRHAAGQSADPMAP